MTPEEARFAALMFLLIAALVVLGVGIEALPLMVRDAIAAFRKRRDRRAQRGAK